MIRTLWSSLYMGFKTKTEIVMWLPKKMGVRVVNSKGGQIYVMENYLTLGSGHAMQYKDRVSLKCNLSNQCFPN